MSFRSGVERAAPQASDRDPVGSWTFRREDERGDDLLFAPGTGLRPRRDLCESEARRVRHVIEAAIGDVFGVPHADISQASRGKAPVALARQAAMYLAHVSCGLCLTDVGRIFARDRTTVAHACAVIEDRRDDPVFDRALELLEWIVPTLVGCDRLHVHYDI